MSRQRQGSQRKIGHSGKLVDMIVSADSSLTHPRRGWLGIVLPHGGVVEALQQVIGRLFLGIARLFLPVGTYDFASNRPLLHRDRGIARDDSLDAAQVTKLLGLRYRAEGRVGCGAVGQVWLVLDRKTLCHRVVKLF